MAAGGRRPRTKGRRRSGSRTMTTKATSASSKTTRTALPFRFDRDGSEEFLVLRGQLGGKASALGPGEEDTRVGAALQDLLDGVARGVRRRQRRLDRLHEALEKPVEVTFSRHCVLTITYGACPPPGRHSLRRSAGHRASSRCARTAGCCQTAASGPIPSFRSA